MRAYNHIMRKRRADWYTLSQFEQAVEYGSITDEDGFGYWTKEGKYSEDDVFDTEPEDADGVIWFNK